MQKWTKEHARLIGKIIFAGFLEHPLKKYRCIIEDVERSSLFERLPIVIKHLSGACGNSRKDADPSRVIAEIVKSDKSFSVRYLYEGFNKMYLFDTRSTGRLVTEGSFARSEIDEVNSCLHKLRRISSRNELTHRIITGIIKHQGRYLSTGNPIDLVPLSQVMLVDRINRRQRTEKSDPDICKTWVSRLVSRLSLIAPSGEEKPLKWFFQTPKDLNKRLIKQILDPIRNGISNGFDEENISLYRKTIGLTDNQLKDILESKYGIILSRRTVGSYRADMGIPPAKERLLGYKYPLLSANFSMSYPLTTESVESNAPANSGIYEFRLKAKEIEIEYPNGKTRVIYMGSTMNVKKRLKEHLSKNSKNGQIRNFLNKYGCFFRYIQLSGNWKEEEKKLYELFVTTYGSAPKCNRVSP